MVDSLLVLLSVYQTLISIEVFAKLQALDIESGDALNPGKNHIDKNAKKSDDDENTLIL